VEGKLHTLDTERLRILTIPGGLAHTLRNRGEATAVAVCWSSGREGDYQGPDTIRG
jgi:dTDP-4-dehydrorhamnose 3,5-epimerase-like enzyme